MERSHRKSWVELQAQASEVEGLKSDAERDRTESLGRPKAGPRPKPTEGKDGDMRFTFDGDGTYVWFRISGEWYKARLERA